LTTAGWRSFLLNFDNLVKSQNSQILRYAKEMDADVIAMGSLGKGGLAGREPWALRHAEY